MNYPREILSVAARFDIQATLNNRGEDIRTEIVSTTKRRTEKRKRNLFSPGIAGFFVTTQRAKPKAGVKPSMIKRIVDD